MIIQPKNILFGNQTVLQHDLQFYHLIYRNSLSCVSYLDNYKIYIIKLPILKDIPLE